MFENTRMRRLFFKCHGVSPLCSHTLPISISGRFCGFGHSAPQCFKGALQILHRFAGCAVEPALKFALSVFPDILIVLKIQERLSVLAAPRMVRSTFLFARLRSAGGVYLSGETRHWTSRILTYPALIEAGVFPTEINQFIFYKIFATISCRMRTKIEKGPPQFRETTQFTADSVQSCAIYRSL